MNITNLFRDETTTDLVKNRLPQLFQIAELESSRAGKIGMEVGSMRERILIALLIHRFGDANVETDIPITEPEVDVKVFGEPVSIKTITRSTLGGVKLAWTVDAQNALDFARHYTPSCDMLLAQINWNSLGYLYLFRQSQQLDVMRTLGKQGYMILPKAGTNPRGVEVSAKALRMLASNVQCPKIEIQWHRNEIDYDPYDRWLTLWRKQEL
ncbi:MAG: ThaI family type II restriction endonuclease [Anaerolineae bacterium]|nr:ThaI family type II restriction endonuclease [Anaerolineae bacterium]